MKRKGQNYLFHFKLADGAKHKKYTGAENRCILSHLDMLKNGSTPYIIRIPLIPGVNDDEENMESTAALLEEAGPLIRVELLPYHKTAGAKYQMVGMEYCPDFDTALSPQVRLSVFQKRSIPVIVL